MYAGSIHPCTHNIIGMVGTRKDKGLAAHQQFVGRLFAKKSPTSRKDLMRWCWMLRCPWLDTKWDESWVGCPRIYFHRLLRRMKTKPYWRLKKKRCFAAKNVLEVLVETSFFQSSLLFPTFDFGCFFSHLLLFGLIKFRSVWTSKMASQKVDGIWVNDLGMHQKKENTAVTVACPKRKAGSGRGSLSLGWCKVVFCPIYVYTLED